MRLLLDDAVDHPCVDGLKSGIISKAMVVSGGGFVPCVRRDAMESSLGSWRDQVKRSNPAAGLKFAQVSSRRFSRRCNLLGSCGHERFLRSTDMAR
jgi:hypothetical protein